MIDKLRKVKSIMDDFCDGINCKDCPFNEEDNCGKVDDAAFDMKKKLRNGSKEEENPNDL